MHLVTYLHPRLPTDSAEEPEDLCDHVNYGYTASANENNIGPKFLRITDIVPETIDWGHVPHCEIDEKNCKNFDLLKEI